MSLLLGHLTRSYPKRMDFWQSGGLILYSNVKWGSWGKTRKSINKTKGLVLPKHLSIGKEPGQKVAEVDMIVLWVKGIEN